MFCQSQVITSFAGYVAINILAVKWVMELHGVGEELNVLIKVMAVDNVRRKILGE